MKAESYRWYRGGIQYGHNRSDQPDDVEKEKILRRILTELIGAGKVDEIEKIVAVLCSLPAASAADQKWKDKYFLVREALMGLVGAENMEELKGIEESLKSMPAPPEEINAPIRAVRVLIETEEG